MHVWSPSICVTQWGAGKNEIMTKNFFAKNHVKIIKSQPTSMDQNGQISETSSKIDKNKFWAEIFFDFFEKF